MMFIIPALFCVFAFLYSAAFSLYLITSSVFSILSTLVVNRAGCFVMGLLAGLLAHTRALSEARWLLLAVGFCGSFTTFSTFAADNLRLLSEKSLPLFLLNLGLSVAGGLLAAWLGYRLVLHFSE